MAKLTPQEKKGLSYEKDRRNRFGQHAKAARKLIPLRKAKARRVSRHTASRIAAVALTDKDGSAVEKAEGRASAANRARWAKDPDSTLAEAIGGKREWRVLRSGRKKGAGTSVEKLASDPEGILQKGKTQHRPPPGAPNQPLAK
ncbi:MAG: hypothetical protein IPL39_12795 [Opitutaceae bacterium]|nr:hypothetical protein [Opitutaceae bacterium]